MPRELAGPAEKRRGRRNVEAGFYGTLIAKGRKGEGFLGEEVGGIISMEEEFDCFKGKAIVEGSFGGEGSEV